METNIWVLIEKYYPLYYSSETIARLNDLSKIMEGEYEKGDCAYNLLQEEYAGETYNPRIRRDHDELYIETLEQVIVNMFCKIEKDGLR